MHNRDDSSPFSVQHVAYCGGSSLMAMVAASYLRSVIAYAKIIAALNEMQDNNDVFFSFVTIPVIYSILRR